ncbi:unnamed protein product [Brassicogethes aeneus]|uniref:Uncharacterized protein n=1 Tax=Brassicogethes aeneus TaxID=1431903 RepID=A0A9P0FME4_BRAAE|nr:unnamed protein product [Brassicogethes aeneus]
MDERECYRIHGIRLDESSADSDSGKSDFDDEYNKYRPKPIVLDPWKIVVISANSPDRKESVNKNTTSKRRYKRRNRIPSSETERPAFSSNSRTASNRLRQVNNLSAEEYDKCCPKPIVLDPLKIVVISADSSNRQVSITENTPLITKRPVISSNLRKIQQRSSSNRILHKVLNETTDSDNPMVSDPLKNVVISPNSSNFKESIGKKTSSNGRPVIDEEPTFADLLDNTFPDPNIEEEEEKHQDEDCLWSIVKCITCNFNL